MSVPLASCPRCGHETLLVNAVAVGLVPVKGYACPWYGNPNLGFAHGGSKVECNRTDCGWQGTIEDAQ